MMAEIITGACGCSVDWHKTHPLQSKINYCPKHAAADDMLEALTDLYEACVLADNHEELSEYVDGFLLDKARTVIARAEAQD